MNEDFPPGPEWKPDITVDIDRIEQVFAYYCDEKHHNFHYMDEDERYSAGVFKTYDEALKKAKRLVEKSLLEFLEPGKSVDDLMALYVQFGEDPWIRPTPDGVERFSAREYARERAAELLSEAAR